MTLDIAAIIASLSAIIAAFLSYQQYAKNKLVDMKVEEAREKREEKKVSRNTQTALVYGQLWQLLHKFNCSRVFIVQPHPLSKQLFISLTYEVLRSGSVSLRESLNEEPMGNYALFCKTLAEEEFIFAANVGELKEEADKRFLALIANAGGDATAVKRLTDDLHDWTGSIFCIWPKGLATDDEETIRKELEVAALAIQYVLPEVV